MTTSASIPTPQNRTLAALGGILVYAGLVGFADNYVRIIAAHGGLWQFHAMRSAMIFGLFLVLALPLGLRLRPVNLQAVAARSLIHAIGILCYFGGLAFLPVAVVAAGLFSAPIFVLLISRFVYHQPIGPFRIAAVAIGFMGVILVLGPAGGELPGLATIVPILAGAFYAMANIATRQWCAGESAEVLTVGFFAMLGLMGLAGFAVLAVWGPAAPDGPDGFVLRGYVAPTGTFLFWTFVQAVASLVGVVAMVKAYQLAEASRVSVFEYLVLPVSAAWTWVLWGEGLGAQAVVGMVLIVAAGLVIALRGR